jgi:hypothetical protein
MTLPLRIVDALDLGDLHRSLLMPDTIVRDYQARKRRLPRFFYAVDSWAAALETRLAPHFAVWEFMTVDLYEPELLRRFPRYIPCAVSLLAAHLEVFRLEVGAPVHIAANGGYRSPSHGRSTVGSPHAWGTAANIYRIGDEYIDDRERIERYSSLAMALLPGARAKSYGPPPAFADDHLHIDIGYVKALPAEAPDEELPWETK